MLSRQTDRSSLHWYALYVRSRHEKKVERQLLDLELETYLPLRKVLRQWSDRKKWVDEPLFRCYLFVRADDRGRYQAIRAAGAVRFVTFQSRPAIVQDEEITAIRDILKENPSAESCPAVSVGDYVEIIRGPLTGLKGWLKAIQNTHRLVVTIDSINQAMRFNVETADVKVLT